MSPAPAAPAPAPIGALGVPDTARAFLFDELAAGTPGDLPGAPTVHGLSNLKNALVLELVVSDLSELLDRP